MRFFPGSQPAGKGYYVAGMEHTGKFFTDRFSLSFRMGNEFHHNTLDRVFPFALENTPLLYDIPLNIARVYTIRIDISTKCFYGLFAGK